MCHKSQLIVIGAVVKRQSSVGIVSECIYQTVLWSRTKDWDGVQEARGGKVILNREQHKEL